MKMATNKTVKPDQNLSATYPTIQYKVATTNSTGNNQSVKLKITKNKTEHMETNPEYAINKSETIKTYTTKKPHGVEPKKIQEYSINLASQPTIQLKNPQSNKITLVKMFPKIPAICPSPTINPLSIKMPLSIQTTSPNINATPLSNLNTKVIITTTSKSTPDNSSNVVIAGVCENSNDDSLTQESDSMSSEKNVKMSREMKCLRDMQNNSKILSEYMTDDKIDDGRKSRKKQDEEEISPRRTRSRSRSKSRQKEEVPKKRKYRRSKSVHSMKSDHEGINESDDCKLSPNSSGRRTNMRSANADFQLKHQKFLHRIHQTTYLTDHSDDEEDEMLDDDGANSSCTDSILMRKNSMSRSMQFPVAPKPGWDKFCWRCNQSDNELIPCNTCIRSYHTKCMRVNQSISDPIVWKCPECIEQERAASSDKLKNGKDKLKIEVITMLLKFVLKRMQGIKGGSMFNPFDKSQNPDYDEYVVHHMDLQILEQNIAAKMYSTTESFSADAKWILHNSLIYTKNNKMMAIAKTITKTCKQEINEIEACHECYSKANTMKNWFVDVCSKPHILVWAKLKGFPYWPAKAMSINAQQHVDVRFFGDHDRAWVPAKDCYLYSEKDPNTTIKQKTGMLDCIKESKIHIQKLESIFGEFHYADFKTPLENKLEEHLEKMLPGINPSHKSKVVLKIIKTADNSLSVSPISSPSIELNISNSGSEPAASSTPVITKIEKKKVSNRRKSLAPPVTGDEDENDEIVAPEPIVKKNRRISCVAVASKSEPSLTTTAPKIEEKVESLVIKRKLESWKMVQTPKKQRTHSEVEAKPAVVAAVSETFEEEKLPTKVTDKVLPPFEHKVGENTEDSVEEKREKSPILVKKKRGRKSKAMLLQLEAEKAMASAETPPEEPVDVVDEKEKTPEDRVQKPTTPPPLVLLSEKAPEIEKEQHTIEPEPQPETTVSEKVVEEPSKEPEKDSGKEKEIEKQTELEKEKEKEPTVLLHPIPFIEIIKLEMPEETEQENEIRATPETVIIEPNVSGSSREDMDTLNVKTEPLSDDEIASVEMEHSILPDNGTVSQSPPVVFHRDKITVRNIHQLTNQIKAAKNIVPHPMERRNFLKTLPKSVTIQRARKSFPGKLNPGPALIKTLPITQQKVVNKNALYYQKGATSMVHMVHIPNTVVTPQQQQQPQQPQKLPLQVNGSSTSSASTSSAPPIPSLSLYQQTKPSSNQPQQTQSQPEQDQNVNPGYITNSMASAIAETMLPQPPKLVPKPTGAIRSEGDYIHSSEAGPVSSLLMANSHKMADFFRSVLEDTLSDLANAGVLAARMIMLEQENERLKQAERKHAEELAKLKHNSDALLMELRNTSELEKKRIINETRRQCEIDRLKSVEETKKKEWCANCRKEAMLYCCWNTTYCNYACRDAHWSRHMNVCAQTQSAIASQQVDNTGPKNGKDIIVATPKISSVTGGRPSQTTIRTLASKNASPATTAGGQTFQRLIFNESGNITLVNGVGVGTNWKKALNNTTPTTSTTTDVLKTKPVTNLLKSIVTKSASSTSVNNNKELPIPIGINIASVSSNGQIVPPDSFVINNNQK